MGILTCLSVASLRLAEAESLLANGYLTAAGIVFSFAVEEFGKAVLLHEAQETDTDPVTVKGFYVHEVKIEAAGRHLSRDDLRLKEGAFDPGVFDSAVFDTPISADLETRLAGLYVDWTGEWQNGAPVDPAVLKASIAGVTAAIAQASAFWT